ncbi:hypothetical protein B0H10DRAFT_1991195 [Mycena sp. CBHHK59/15]|nr:hypothetical protein B0H10DRAFT_1991195 [Mycena sp. CBHHK59/15]
MLSASQLPKSLWAEAWRHSVWLRNRAPTRALPNETTPFEMVTGEKPNLANLRKWGCKAWVKQAKSPKLSDKAVEGRFVGYDDESKDAYRMVTPPASKAPTAPEIPESPKRDDATPLRDETDKSSVDSTTHLEDHPKPPADPPTPTLASEAPAGGGHILHKVRSLCGRIWPQNRLNVSSICVRRRQRKVPMSHPKWRRKWLVASDVRSIWRTDSPELAILPRFTHQNRAQGTFQEPEGKMPVNSLDAPPKNTLLVFQCPICHADGRGSKNEHLIPVRTDLKKRAMYGNGQNQ